MYLTLGAIALSIVLAQLDGRTSFIFPFKHNGRRPSAINMQSLRWFLQKSSYLRRTNCHLLVCAASLSCQFLTAVGETGLQFNATLYARLNIFPLKTLASESRIEYQPRSGSCLSMKNIPDGQLHVVQYCAMLDTPASSTRSIDLAFMFFILEKHLSKALVIDSLTLIIFKHSRFLKPNTGASIWLASNMSMSFQTTPLTCPGRLYVPLFVGSSTPFRLTQSYEPLSYVEALISDSSDSINIADKSHVNGFAALKTNDWLGSALSCCSSSGKSWTFGSHVQKLLSSALKQFEQNSMQREFVLTISSMNIDLPVTLFNTPGLSVPENDSTGLQFILFPSSESRYPLKTTTPMFFMYSRSNSPTSFFPIHGNMDAAVLDIVAAFLLSVAQYLEFVAFTSMLLNIFGSTSFVFGFTTFSAYRYGFSHDVFVEKGVLFFTVSLSLSIVMRLPTASQCSRWSMSSSSTSIIFQQYNALAAVVMIGTMPIICWLLPLWYWSTGTSPYCA